MQFNEQSILLSGKYLQGTDPWADLAPLAEAFPKTIVAP